MLGEVFRARVGVDAETGATYINLHSNFCLDHDKGLIFLPYFLTYHIIRLLLVNILVIDYVYKK